MNGDSFCDIDFIKLRQFHIKKKSNVTVVLSQVSNIRDFGNVLLASDDCIIGFREKEGGTTSGLVNAGIYLINRTFIAKIPAGKRVSLEQNIFPAWIGSRLYAYKNNHKFIDIGTSENYKNAAQFLARYQV